MLKKFKKLIDVLLQNESPEPTRPNILDLKK